MYKRLLWIAILAAGLSLLSSITHSTHVSADCNGGSTTSRNFLLNWCPTTESPSFPGGDNVGLSCPASVNGGSTATCTGSYSSAGAAPGGVHVVSWTNIVASNSVMSSVSSNGSSADAGPQIFANNCFNIVTSSDYSPPVTYAGRDGPRSQYYASSPYHYDGWRAGSSPGGMIACDPLPDRSNTGWWNSHFYPPGNTADNIGSSGAALVWYQNSSSRSANFSFKINTKPVSTTQKICLRFHVSVTTDNLLGSGHWGNSTTDLQQMSQDDVPDMVGMKGAGQGSLCFDVNPAPCTPGVPPCGPTGGPSSTGITCGGAHMDPPNASNAQTMVSINGTNLGTPASYIVHHTDSALSVGFIPYAQNVSMTYYDRYHIGNSWVNGPSTTLSHGPCYSATCQIIGVDGYGGPGNLVVQGGGVQLTVRITNTGGVDGNQPLYDPFNATRLAVSGTGGSFTTGFGMPPPGQPGSVQDFTFDMLVSSLNGPGSYPPNSAYDSADFVVNYQNSFTVSSPCGRVPIDVYQPFSAHGVPSVTMTPTQEDPSNIAYNTAVCNGASNTACTPGSLAVYIPTSSKFTGPNCPNVGPIPQNQNWNPGLTTTAVNGNCIPTALHGGDSYCAEIDLGYTSGYVGQGGPSDIQLAAGPTPYTNCNVVHNEPFVKAYNSSVSTGSGYQQGSVCPGGGILASWNNDSGTNPTSGNFGAGAQLNTLAALGITGFASAQQPPPTLTPTHAASISFANQAGDINAGTGNDSPNLGGNYGSTDCITLPQESDTHTNMSDNPTNAVKASGSYHYGSVAGNVNLQLNGGSFDPGNNVQIFVDGNVYISGDITYNHAEDNTWTVNNAPAFKLVATGNIYIDPSVGQLDGTYIADGTGSSGNGNIYTCSDPANHFKYMDKSILFDNCNKQLAVNGSFQANKVNLMRTVGSLRDEKPVSSTPGFNSPIMLGKDWSSCSPGTGATIYGCTNDGQSVYSYENFDARYLMTAPAAPDIKLSINYSNYSKWMGSPSPWPPPDGSPYRVEIDINDVYVGDYNLPTGSSPPPFVLHWTVNQPIRSVTVKWKNNQWIPCAGGNPSQCYDPNFEINALQLSEPGSAATQPVNPACDNDGGRKVTLTCAAEVFTLTPELYLPSQTIGKPSVSSQKFQAFTSLPPVL
jgi:hypothetical protein